MHSLVVSAVVRLFLCSSLRGVRLLGKGEVWGVGLWLCFQCRGCLCVAPCH